MLMELYCEMFKPQRIVCWSFSVRKAFLEGMLSAEAKRLDNQARFILEKIEGKIIIENRRKNEIIRTLQERGYESDPVKVWKESQNKDIEESDIDEEEVTDRSGPDYDYLLGMSLLSLTRAKKDELLKKRDDKQAELERLREKTPSNLWEDDLESFMEALDKVEEKEREDEMTGVTGKALKLGKIGAGKGKKKIILEETKPSPTGQQIVPRIDPELRRRIEKALGGEGKKRGRPRKDDDGVRKDGDDDIPLPLAERVRNSPDKLTEMKAKKAAKTTKVVRKTSPKAAEKGPKRNPWSSESESSMSAGSDIDEKLLPAEKREMAPRRAAAAAACAKFTFDSDEEMEDQSDKLSSEETTAEDIDTVMEKNRQKKCPKKKASSEGSDDEFMPKVNKVSVAQKMPLGGAGGRKKKPEDGDGVVKPAAKGKKAVKKQESDEDCILLENFSTEQTKQRAQSARRGAPVKRFWRGQQ